jgi:hypothetical protein
MPRLTAQELLAIRWGNKTPEERFLSHVVVDGRDCWIWTGALNNAGYGVMNTNGSLVLAHRWALEHWRGPIPNRLDVCHTCDVRACVNPDHQFLGTRFDNMADARAKGRIPQGSARPQAKLNESAIQEIRRRISAGEFHRSIAADFGVSRSMISRIARGESWGHVA